MLSIYGIKSAADAVSYYEQDNYYHKGSTEALAATHWWGKGAEQLNLNDYVEPERFAELLEGRIDSETTLGRKRHDGGVEHRPGYDLTFSAPKSVSMLAEIGQDFRLYDAHNEAVNAALTYLESTIAKYRQTIDGDTEVKLADNLIVAKFRHDTSREVDDTVDCQLHTHCIVMNAIKCHDGKWRSLFSDSVFDYKMLGGMIYRSALAKAVKALGYEIEQTREDGLFEIKGFTREQIEHFSTRRIKICEVMQEKGLFGALAAAAVTTTIRQSKGEIDRNILLETWQTRAKELNIDLGKIISNSIKIQRQVHARIDDPTFIAEQALSHAIKHLGERQSVFAEKDLLFSALAYSLGEATVTDIERTISQFVQTQSLVYLGEHNQAKCYTSPDIKAREQAIIDIMHRGKNEVSAIASQETAQLFIEEMLDKAPPDAFYTDCQRHAIEFLATNTDRVTGIQGYAGTGKTVMLNSFCQLAQAAGFTLRGAAPSAAAKNVLQLETGIKTSTLAGLLIHLNNENNLADRPVDPNEIIILDEASMASTHQMETLLKRCEILNKRVILIGDRDQLPAVESGAPFALLQDEGLHFGQMRQIIRQRSNYLADAVQSTIDRKIDYAFDTVQKGPLSAPGNDRAYFNTHSTVNEIDAKQERLDAIVQKYWSFDKMERRNTIVALGSNADRQAINDRIRDKLKQFGEVETQEIACDILLNKGMTISQKSHIVNFEEGDIVRFNKQYRRLGIKRYDYLTVEKVDKDNKVLILTKPSGKKIQWDPTKSASSKGGAVEVFTKEKRALAAGDTVRWSHNQEKRGIFNSETARVLSVKDNKAIFQTEHDQQIELEITQDINKHWDYAWSSTVYAAQGKKASNVIGLLESYNKNLTNFSSFYVMLSRSVDTIHLYVDNLQNCIKTVESYTGEKSNATTFLKDFVAQQQFEATLQHAHEKLTGNVVEQTNRFERLDSLAKHYCNLYQNPAENPYLIVANHHDQKQLIALIRDELKKAQQIRQEDIKTPCLHERFIRSIDGRTTLEEGALIAFKNDFKRYGIERQDWYRVESIRDVDNLVTLKHNSGKVAQVDAEFLINAQDAKHLKVYYESQALLSTGDTIVWTRSEKSQGIVAHEQAIVKQITKHFITLKFNNDKIVTFEQGELSAMHWRHDYVHHIADQAPKVFTTGLAHIDEKVKSPAKIKSLFGAMGRAEKTAFIYTHSGSTINNQYQTISGLPQPLFIERNQEKNKSFYQTLSRFEDSKIKLSKAWVSYFEAKASGSSIEENLQNAVILDRAHTEITSKLIQHPDYDHSKIRALGFNLENIKKYTDKHVIIDAVDRYTKAQGIRREKLAHDMVKHPALFSQELRLRSIETRKLYEDAWRFGRRMERLTYSPEKRCDSKLVDCYFQHSVDARRHWTRIYRTKDRGIKPDRQQVAFASHLSRLRNQIAFEIRHNPKRFDSLTNCLTDKTQQLIKTHADKYQAEMERQVKRQKLLASKDWRQTIAFDRQTRQRAILQVDYSLDAKKIYWDKDLVLSHVKGQAEHIISDLVTEEKNTRLSSGAQLVWGKKNGSIRYHTAGPKEGQINDYERNIHGDLIHYYAQRRGIDWYDALSDLASIAGINPNHAELKPIVQSPEEIAKKEAQQLAELKRQQRSQQIAQKLWNESQPIKGTLVEKYLTQHRGMQFDLSKLDVRFHPNAPSYISYKNGETRLGKPKPAMVVRFVNDQGELTAVQCTYLNKATADKDKTAFIKKNTIGLIGQSAGIIYRGGNDKAIIAEGCETAASLIPAEKNASIYITGGNMQKISHFKFIAESVNSNVLHIAADNDLSLSAPSWQSIEKGACQLAQRGVQSLISRPQSINNEKTDYNDVLKTHGIDAIKNQFKPTYEIKMNAPITHETKLTPIEDKHKELEQTMEI